MKQIIFRGVLMTAVIATMGCRVERIDTPRASTSLNTNLTNLAVTPAVINTSAEGAQAASQILQTRELTATSTKLFKNIGDISLFVMTPALLNQNTDISCSDGGSFKYSGTYSSSNGSYSLSFAFSGCRDKGYQYVGSTTVNGTPSNFTVTLGSSSTFNIFNFNTTYTVLLAYLKANLSFTMAGSGTATDASYAINANGTITSFDYFLLNTFAMTFSGFNSTYTLATDGTTTDETITVSTNGQFNENWGGTYSVNIRATNFTVSKTKYFDANSGTYYAEDSSVSGTVLYAVTPSSFGFRGLFNVNTQTPVRTVYSPQRQTTQGVLGINGTATVQYNAGGDMTVNVTGDTPRSYAKEYDLMKTADFAAMEQDKPPLIAPPAPGVVSTVTGSTMGVTLTWTGPPPTYSSTSDMDLHMKYYNTTTPTASTAETWHVDWHQGITCANPSGLVYGDGFDIDGDGVCDVGLDFDDTDGYGPEHITALRMPPGYYVISVDSFSLNNDVSASLYLSVNVGDNIFGAYLATLSADDGEAPLSNAWLRVADVRVNANGTVDVLSPDPALTPWH